MSSPPSAAKDFFHAPCPSCGGPVTLASSASAFAVCPFCHNSLALQDQSLQQLGHVSQVLEDYSVLRLGVTGRWQDKAFTVIGRIQLSYPGGFWNEWYLLFEDNRTGWLSDASGQYAVLHEQATSTPLLPFEVFKPGQKVRLEHAVYTVSDRRTAQCVGAEGELPFAVSERWTARVVDLRHAGGFATLDYSQAQPVVYSGASVTLQQLQAQMLRSEEDIQQSAGRLKNKLQPLTCPHCGSSVSAVGGATHVANCGHCGSVLDVSSKTASLITEGKRAHGRQAGTFLQAGDSGVLRGVRWTVLGVVMQSCRQEGETYSWTEYLLFSPKEGFRWLSQSYDGQWLLATVLDRWPTELSTTAFGIEKSRFELSDSYEAKVERVWGSFNWLIQAGDRVQCEEYRVKPSNSRHPPGSVLVRETTADEQLWSLCVPVEADKVAAAFGKARTAPVREVKPSKRAPSDQDFLGFLKGATHLALWSHLILFCVAPTFAGFLLGSLVVGGLYLTIWVAEDA